MGKGWFSTSSLSPFSPPQSTTAIQSQLGACLPWLRVTHLLSSSYFDLQREMGRNKRACLSSSAQPQGAIPGQGALSIPPAALSFHLCHQHPQLPLQILLPDLNQHGGEVAGPGSPHSQDVTQLCQLLLGHLPLLLRVPIQVQEVIFPI